MALINQNDLFDSLKIYIDKKLDNLEDQLRDLFEEYNLKDVIAMEPLLIDIMDNIEVITAVGNNIVDVVKVAAVLPEIIKVAYIDTKVIMVSDIDDEVAIVANIADSVVDVSSEPLRQAILDADDYNTSAQVSSWESEASNMTATSYAVEATEVIEYVSDVDGTFTGTPTGLPSAKTSADEIKVVSVKDPVISVPNTPTGEPGVPTVIYNHNTGQFEFGIPVGSAGTDGNGFTVKGDATVAEMNALPDVDNVASDAWRMTDAGTITSGTEDVVVAIDDWVVWGDTDIKWINVGPLEGVEGPQGVPGTAATLDAGTTTTGAEGTSATVTNVGTSAAAIFNFTIPRGDKGVQGDMGPAGLTPEGEITVADINAIDFATVPVGAVYIMLDAGTVTTGPTPVDVIADDWLGKGNLGDWINLGPLQGDTGPEGPVGPAGAKGDTGDQGIPGLGVYLMGDATVADLNALATDPGVGDTWVMTDAGTITYGIDDVVVVIDDTVGWAEDLSFTNLGPIVGPPGEDGTDGTNGTDGVDGIDSTVPGPIGPDGAAATIAVGTVSKVAAGGTPTITNSGTAAAAIFDFGVVTGDTGIAGPEGPDGATGQPGPEGVQGPIGLTGPIGNVEAGTTPVLIIVSCTQAEYDVLTPVATTVYIIVG